MSDSPEKRVKGYLYGEINRLKQYISDMDYEHYAELRTWTKKCGQFGNEIGSLRKQLAENEYQEKLWIEKYDRLQKQLAEKQTELHEAKVEKKELDYQTLIDESQNQVQVVRQLIQEKDGEVEHQDHDVITVEAETESKLDDCLETEIPIKTEEIMDSASDAPEISVENTNLCKDLVSGPINETEADGIVKAYCSSDNKMETDKIVSNPVESNELIQDSRTDSPGSITDQVRHDDDAKQKAKFHFWNTLKKRVSLKGKQVKPTPSASKVSESEL